VYRPRVCVITFFFKNTQETSHTECEWRYHVFNTECRKCSVHVIFGRVSIKANSELIKLWSNTTHKEMKSEWDGEKQLYIGRRLFMYKGIGVGRENMNVTSQDKSYEDRQWKIE